MATTPTVYDVAAHARVSIATVSRALRSPSTVSASTRDRVLDSVRELGYVPSASARGLAARRTGVLGVFFPAFEQPDQPGDADLEPQSGVSIVRDVPGRSELSPPDPYVDELLRGAQLHGLRHGFTIMVGLGGDENVAELIGDMAGRVDGLAVLAGSVPDEVIAHVARRIPVTLIAGARHSDGLDQVTVSNSEGMRALTEHLIDTHDARDLVYLAGPADSPDDEERYRGFMQALLGRGMDPSAVPVLPADFSRNRARTVVEQLVDGGTLPRALVCANDQMALGALDAFAARSVRVPEEVIVTGFDGIEAGSRSTPRLTTVDQPMVDLGRAAMHTLLRRIESPELPSISLRLPVQVLLRESSEGSDDASAGADRTL